MALETPTYISDLVSTNPVGSDNISDGDAHIRNLKSSIKATFPNIAGAVTPTHTELNYVDGVTSALQTQLDAKAPTASPTFTGTITGAAMTLTGAVTLTGASAVTVPTPTASTQAATKAYVDGAVGSGAGVWTLLKSTTAASDATIDFVNGTGGVIISSTYDEYMVELIAVLPASNAVFYMRTSTDAGSTYPSSAADYSYNVIENVSGSVTGTVNVNGTETRLTTTQVGSGSGQKGVYGTVRFYKPSAASKLHILSDLAFLSGTTAMIHAIGSSVRAADADVDAIRFLFDSGNIASGTFNLYARRKS